MKLSKKVQILQGQQQKKIIKKPKDIVTRLNQQISCVQEAVKQYNQREKKLQHWKKQLQHTGKTCPLKTLTEPKYQNILFESNFNNNSILMKNMSNSVIKKSIIRKGNYSRKASLYESNYGLKKTFSLMKGNRNSEVTQNQQNRKSEHFKKREKNPQTQNELNQNTSLKQSSKLNPQFASFRQQVGKFDKLVYLSKNYKQNYSSRSGKSKVNPFNSNFDNNYTNSIVLTDDNDRLSVIGQQSKSIMMQSSLKPLAKMRTMSKQSLLFPLAQQKHLHTVTSTRNSRSLRNRISQKTIELQKQWVKTMQYRQKYKILKTNEGETQSMQNFNLIPNLTLTNGKGRVMSRLESILQKVQVNRPKTSISKNHRQTQTSCSLVNQQKTKRRTLANTNYQNNWKQQNNSKISKKKSFLSNQSNKQINSQLYQQQQQECFVNQNMNNILNNNNNFNYFYISDY